VRGATERGQELQEILVQASAGASDRDRDRGRTGSRVEDTFSACIRLDKQSAVLDRRDLGRGSQVLDGDTTTEGLSQDLGDYFGVGVGGCQVRRLLGRAGGSSG